VRAQECPGGQLVGAARTVAAQPAGSRS
jgi:hypothetical protein